VPGHGAGDTSPLYGVKAEDIVVRSGRLHVQGDPARGETYQRLLARNHLTHLGADGSYAGPQGPERHSYYSYGAVFTEVAVNATRRYTSCRTRWISPMGRCSSRERHGVIDVASAAATLSSPPMS
jgi:CO/xanthine dehydrogenase Mo-binding subunit